MADLPSLDELAARAERFDQAQLALRRDLSGQVVHGRDDHDLVEVGADSDGQIIEVAVNATLVGRVDPTVLANAVLQAASAAQHQARRLVAERTAYHLG